MEMTTVANTCQFPPSPLWPEQAGELRKTAAGLQYGIHAYRTHKCYVITVINLMRHTVERIAIAIGSRFDRASACTRSADAGHRHAQLITLSTTVHCHCSSACMTGRPTHDCEVSRTCLVPGFTTATRARGLH